MKRNTEKRIRILGRSDDNIYIEGDRYCQFSGGDKPVTMEFSEGTKLSIVYSPQGLWKIDRIQEGTIKFTEIFKADYPADDYSDEIELVGDFWWVKVGNQVEYIQDSVPQEFRALREKCVDVIHECEDGENVLELVLLECWQHFRGAK